MKLTCTVFLALWMQVTASVVLAAAPTAVRVLPDRVELTGAKSAQRLLVESEDNGSDGGDVSANARFMSSDAHVAVVSADGVVRPVGDGDAIVTATVAGRTATATVHVVNSRSPFVWSFRNHVLPVLTKVGCNGGACHGAAAGKGGLKLSLRGFDPISDHNVLTRQAMGRRVVPGDPLHSLMVLKPSFAIPHGGGLRLPKGSADYKVIYEWIKSGAPRPLQSDARISGLEVYPDVASLKPGDSQRIVVDARYSDGHVEDVTRWVKFGTSDSTVANVDDNGLVKVSGAGQAAITIWFNSKVAFASIVSPFPNGPAPAVFKSAPRANFIDDLVLAKLQALGIPPSPRCSDWEFLRRAYLDTIGVLPTPDETKRFLADSAPDKRAKLIDTLLTRPEFVDYWSYKWSDLLLVSTKRLGGQPERAFYNWIRSAVERNVPWDRFARELITATGSNLDNGAVNYFVLHKDPIDLAETTTQAFLGMSVTCARCHNHPLEKWTQRDYYQFANLFARVRLKDGDRGGETLVLTAKEGDIPLPRLGIALPPKPLDGAEFPLDDPRDRRAVLAEWLTSKDNPYFSRALVNRVWRNFMGRGIVEAEDDLRLTNPPSDAPLLNALAVDFSGHGFDVKRLIKLIVSSEAYQRSSEPDGVNAKDDRYYSRYLVKRLPAEVILDALSEVTGVPTTFDGFPKGTRAMQLPDSQVGSYFLTAFGRPERERTCACERQQEPTIAQALHLTNGDTINMKLRATGGVIDNLIKSNATDSDALTSIYLSALCREPSTMERTQALAALAEPTTAKAADAKPARRAALEDLYWAVLTDREFLFNH